MDWLKLVGFAPANGAGDAGENPDAPLGGTRSEAIQRLQVGVAGIGAMLLLVALATVINSRARVADENAVPQAAPTTEPVAAPAGNDPLADAGIVPDMPVEPAAQPAPQQGPVQAPQVAPGQDAPASRADERGQAAPNRTTDDVQRPR